MVPRARDHCPVSRGTQHIADCASEAFRCRSVNANRAAVLLARTTIEATAKHYGITNGNLKSKIDKMASDGLIRPRLAEATHSLRLLGNDQAHGDVDQDVTGEDADAVLVVMQGIFAATFEQDAAIAHLNGRVGDQDTRT